MALGNWVQSQRSNKNLSSEKKERLDDLGFVWDAQAEKWEDGFKELASYKQTTGHSSPPQNHKTPSGYSLGRWALAQRLNKNLSSERKGRLDELGFEFVWHF